jgi:hypothetical protein
MHNDSQATIVRLAVDVNTAASNVLVAAQGTGKKIRVLYFFLVSVTANTITFEDTDGTNLTGAMALGANGGISGTAAPWGIFETPANKGLNLLLTGATQVGGILHYQVIGGTSAG